MFRTFLSQRLYTLLIAALACAIGQLAQAQQTGGGTTGGGTTTGGTTGGATGTGTSDNSITLDRPELTTDIDELAQEQESGFVGTSDINTDFLGVNGAGENANNQSNRQFNTRTQNQNVNQGTQTQPMYRTFGANNTPYRSPHKIAFEVHRPPGRSIDLSLVRNVRILSSRRPQFESVQFVVTEANTVTLRGTVASEDDLKLAMLYVKMESGVDRVINELQVTAVNPTPLTPAAGQ